MEDARILGSPQRKMAKYLCEVCQRTRWAEHKPECGNCGVWMVPVPARER